MISENQKQDHDTPQDGEVIVEVVDLETHAASGKKPPKTKRYRIRVNADHVQIAKPDPTGAEILTAAGLTPPERWTLRLKIHGGTYEIVRLDHQVDLTRPGVEKFKALPNDQSEG
ncbi:multiubiquitin domain-containing protein [Aerolutibacter ruishenii]|uniref:Multiubiquitin n=1 Tax=Aerolutibacter ruishenii TaxID=686800 RepID=A0A562LFK3_9GAMM|nr:multiubiquitin domain-containing protein [Lysobacter ruishenii]TWI06375.1 multiubiquitin [Lysobacter ruishenii]